MDSELMIVPAYAYAYIPYPTLPYPYPYPSPYPHLIPSLLLYSIILNCSKFWLSDYTWELEPFIFIFHHYIISIITVIILIIIDLISNID